MGEERLHQNPSQNNKVLENALCEIVDCPVHLATEEGVAACDDGKQSAEQTCREDCKQRADLLKLDFSAAPTTEKYRLTLRSRSSAGTIPQPAPVDILGVTRN